MESSGLMSASKSLLQHVSSIWAKSMAVKGMDTTLIPRLQVIGATPGKVECQLRVEESHLNRLETLHGGVIAALVDVGGSLACTTKGYDITGVSTDINVSYLSSAKLGDVLCMTAKCEKFGRTLAFTNIELRVKDRLVAQGRHTKYVGMATHVFSEENLSIPKAKEDTP
ncbi:MAG: HotDog domain-containing protein [Piptocephalis tieghemiana]|nr:MAG: HotDog domain-containing protein [Piptocephalis tieghemiana]